MRTKDLTFEEQVKQLLPHGSGINGEWIITVSGMDSKDIAVKASNVFSAMDERGGYCHDYEFSLTFAFSINAGIIWDVSPVLVKDNFNCDCGIQLEDYLYDTIVNYCSAFVEV